MIGSYFMTVRFFDLRPDHCLEAHMMNQIQDDVDFFIILSNDYDRSVVPQF